MSVKFRIEKETVHHVFGEDEGGRIKIKTFSGERAKEDAEFFLKTLTSDQYAPVSATALPTLRKKALKRLTKEQEAIISERYAAGGSLEAIAEQAACDLSQVKRFIKNAAKNEP